MDTENSFNPIADRSSLFLVFRSSSETLYEVWKAQAQPLLERYPWFPAEKLSCPAYIGLTHLGIFGRQGSALDLEFPDSNGKHDIRQLVDRVFARVSQVDRFGHCCPVKLLTHLCN